MEPLGTAVKTLAVLMSGGPLLGLGVALHLAAAGAPTPGKGCRLAERAPVLRPVELAARPTPAP